MLSGGKRLDKMKTLEVIGIFYFFKIRAPIILWKGGIDTSERGREERNEKYGSMKSKLHAL